MRRIPVPKQRADQSTFRRVASRFMLIVWLSAAFPIGAVGHDTVAHRLKTIEDARSAGKTDFVLVLVSSLEDGREIRQQDVPSSRSLDTVKQLMKGTTIKVTVGSYASKLLLEHPSAASKVLAKRIATFLDAAKQGRDAPWTSQDKNVVSIYFGALFYVYERLLIEQEIIAAENVLIEFVFQKKDVKGKARLIVGHLTASDKKKTMFATGERVFITRRNIREMVAFIVRRVGEETRDPTTDSKD